MATINISDWTNKEPEGGGAFDDLMESAKAHLLEEFQNNRINENDYSKVYLGMLEAAMAQSLQFILGKQQADKQADLLTAQIANTEQDTLNKVEQTQLTVTQNQLAKQQVINATIEGKVLIGQSEKMEQEVLVAQQEVLNMQQEVLKTAAEVSLLGKQEDKIDADIVLAQQQLQTQQAEIALINARKDLVDAQVLSEASQRLKIDKEIDLISAQITKITQENSLIAQRVLNLIAEELKIDAETNLLAQRLLTEIQQTTLITNQAAKISAETDLIVEKKWTERAQYSDTTGSPSAAVAGVIGKNKELLTRQADGFLRDAEQKAAKIAVDSWNVRMSADPTGTNVTSTSLDNVSIGQIVDKLKTGVGI